MAEWTTKDIEELATNAVKNSMITQIFYLFYLSCAKMTKSSENSFWSFGFRGNVNACSLNLLTLILQRPRGFYEPFLPFVRE